MRWGRKRWISHEQEATQRITELATPRRIIVEAYKVEHRHVECDLHNGAQQCLVAAATKVGEAQLSPAVENDPVATQLLAEANIAIQEGLGAPRQTIRGIHPQLLRQQGFSAALEEVVATAANQVRIVAPQPLPELPEGVLAVGYFFACEAIRDTAKYAPRADVTVPLAADRNLRVSVMDRGPGGARIVSGHGLAGMRERLAAAGDELTISSPPGRPTQLATTTPLLLDRDEPAVVIP